MSGVSLFDVLYRTGTLITTESIPASTVNTGRVCALIHIFTFIYPCVQAKSVEAKYLSHNLSQKKMEQGSRSLCPELHKTPHSSISMQQKQYIATAILAIQRKQDPCDRTYTKTGPTYLRTVEEDWCEI